MSCLPDWPNPDPHLSLPSSSRVRRFFDRVWGYHLGYLDSAPRRCSGWRRCARRAGGRPALGESPLSHRCGPESPTPPPPWGPTATQTFAGPQPPARLHKYARPLSDSACDLSLCAFALCVLLFHKCPCPRLLAETHVGLSAGPQRSARLCTLHLIVKSRKGPLFLVPLICEIHACKDKTNPPTVIFCLQKYRSPCIQAAAFTGTSTPVCDWVCRMLAQQ